MGQDSRLRQNANRFGPFIAILHHASEVSTVQTAVIVIGH